MQDIIDEQLEKLVEQESPIIGFHIRGGDKIYEDKALVGFACPMLPL